MKELVENLQITVCMGSGYLPAGQAEYHIAWPTFTLVSTNSVSNTLYSRQVKYFNYLHNIHNTMFNNSKSVYTFFWSLSLLPTPITWPEVLNRSLYAGSLNLILIEFPYTSNDNPGLVTIQWQRQKGQVLRSLFNTMRRYTSTILNSQYT
jgi:hypothetical protein